MSIDFPSSRIYAELYVPDHRVSTLHAISSPLHSLAFFWNAEKCCDEFSTDRKILEASTFVYHRSIVSFARCLHLVISFTTKMASLGHGWSPRFIFLGLLCLLRLHLSRPDEVPAELEAAAAAAARERAAHPPKAEHAEDLKGHPESDIFEVYMKENLG